MKNLKYWLWFSRQETIGPKLKMYLLEKFKCPEIIYFAKKEELLTVKKITEKIAEDIVDERYKKDLDQYEQYILRNKIELITYYDKEYPQKLKEIYDPPVALYIKGNKEILNDNGFAIVGCRNCSKYGEEIAKKFGYNIANKNLTVISGMAKGIDTYSHLGAIYAKGKTIAVVGCGLDQVYPLENKYLFQKIIETGGAIVSEYIVGTKPVAKNFPARNRIISGLSNGVIVVEAKEKSGTLITVDFALEQGKDIYAVPGNVNSENSTGTNELLKQGAIVITKIEDIV